MCTHIKMDAECNETTLAVSFDQCHEDFMILENDVKFIPKLVLEKHKSSSSKRNKDRNGISDLQLV